MTNPNANDNHRKDVDRWDDEGGGPLSPQRSRRPDPATLCFQTQSSRIERNGAAPRRTRQLP